MTYQMTRARSNTRSLLACLLAIIVLLPGTSTSQEAEYDPEWFDCFGIRRDGSLLLHWEGSGLGAVLTEFSCIGESCVNREEFTANDGTASVGFWHLYFPEGTQRYISTQTRWTKNSGPPESHRVDDLPLRGCFTMTLDSELWIQDLVEARYEGNEVHADNRVGNYRADYFYAPTRLLGDWSDATLIVFEKKSSGGRYFGGYYGKTYGDVVLKNGSMRASYEIPEHHTGEWQEFRVPLDGDGWRLWGGATSVADVLENVTVFQIRAEYASGVDTAAIRNVVIE
jgi:hypothetical protein